MPLMLTAVLVLIICCTCSERNVPWQSPTNSLDNARHEHARNVPGSAVTSSRWVEGVWREGRQGTPHRSIHRCAATSHAA